MPHFLIQRLAEFIEQAFVETAANEGNRVVTPGKAMGTGGDMRIEDTGSQLGIRYKGTKRREKMTLSHAAVAGQGERCPLIRLDRSDFVEPFRHEVGGPVREVIAGHGFSGIRREIFQILVGADLYDVFYFFLNGCHLEVGSGDWGRSPE